MKNFKQKSLFDNKEFELQDEQVYIKTKSLNENYEYPIRYDELGFDIMKKNDKSGLITVYFLGSLTMLFFVALVNAIIQHYEIGQICVFAFPLVICGILTILSLGRANKDMIFLMGGKKNFGLFRNKPNEEVVNEFIKSIHDQMRLYYKTKFAIVEKQLPVDFQIQRFNWLKKIEAINEKEYNELVANLNNGTPIVGFRHDQS